MITKCFLLLFTIVCLNSAYYNAANFADAKAIGCSADGDCLSSPIDCQERCGCDRAYYYNATTDECVLDIRELMQVLISKYDAQARERDTFFICVDYHSGLEAGMSKKIRVEAEKLFKGVIISVIIFVSCAAICVLTACVYCFRINYTDRRLRGDVKALAKKLQRDGNLKKSIVKQPRKPVSESCNVIVEDAGVFVC